MKLNKKQLTIPQKVLCFIIQKQIEKGLSELNNDLFFQPKLENMVACIDFKKGVINFCIDNSTPIKTIIKTIFVQDRLVNFVIK